MKRFGVSLEEDLLKYSNSIRLEDDLTLLEIRFCGRDFDGKTRNSP